jgi:two-component system, LuxR family, sensor histidine kinase TtrS
MHKRIVMLVVSIACIWLLPVQSYAQELKIGVLANRGALQAQKEWKATADYLSTKTGKQFVVIPLTYDQITPFTKDGKIDFLISNPATYAELNKLYGIQAVATMVNQYKNQQLDQMSSTVFAKKDSPAKSLQDFKGKEFGCASESAFGGWLMTLRMFVEGGMNPKTELKLRSLDTHDNVVYAVMNGAVAGGSVRSGTLEKMADEGKIKMDDIRIINQVSDAFPLVHSTQLYPEYPMAALSQVPSAVKTDVGQALIAMASTDSAATNAKIAGWKKAMDYAPVVECLVAIKYGAFGR